MILTRPVSILSVNFKLCLVEVFSNPLRTFITSFGIFLGVVALLWDLAFVRAMEADIKSNLEQLGGLTIINIQEKEPVTRREKMAFQQSRGVTLEEVVTIAQRHNYIKSVLPIADLRWQRIRFKDKSTWSRVKGVSLHHHEAFSYTIDKGKWFSMADFAEPIPVIILGSGVVERIWGEDANPLGEEIVMRSIPFKVVGITQSSSRQNERARECLIPYPYYLSRFGGYRRSREEIAVQLIGTEYIDLAEAQITTELTAMHRGVTDFEFEIARDKIAEQRKASFGMKVLLFCIAAISLLVGGISIMNIMFATIGERIREIGIRKALGAKRFDIFAQFIIEAIFVCVIGGGMGMVVGASITFFPEDFFPFNPMLTIADYALAFGFTLVAGFFSGLVPAAKAANMQPVEALCY
ncbi:MAG: FtsX-like permease family protein [Chitinivibrionales bacterium]|nr:FtsX-like permease family protein [Chitinivibrionales bacterium]